MAHIFIEKPGFRFLPVEQVLTGYFLLTGVLLLSRFTLLEHALSHLMVRALALGIILFFSYHSNMWRIHTLRLIWPLALLPYLYSETDYLNNIFIHHDLDPFFSRAEWAIFQTQPALVFSVCFPSNVFAELMYLGYISYYFMILLVPVTIYFLHNRRQLERIGFILIHSFLMYYIIYIFLPVGGPQYYFAESIVSLPDGIIFGPLLRLIQRSFEGPTAAFPSSHISICLMLVWMSYKYARPLFYYLLPISLLLIFSTIYIQAHYVIDIFAGIIVTPIFYVFSDKVYAFLVHHPFRTYLSLAGGQRRNTTHRHKGR